MKNSLSVSLPDVPAVIGRDELLKAGSNATRIHFGCADISTCDEMHKHAPWDNCFCGSF